jgi:phenylalanyl-tRNA synthetase beta chain
MIISQRWLQEFTEIPCSPTELDQILTMLGLEVESITNHAEQLRGFVVGEVLTREKHPNADKLSVCTVKISPHQVNTIVCGAANVAAGQKVPVATEGAIVPNGGFTIARRKIRGIESNGMICNQEELGLADSSDGIWVLPADAPVGTSLAEYLDMNDVLYDISITPNRADCLSHLGIAREIAAYFNQPLHLPAIVLSEDTTATAEHITVRIDDADVCWRFAARVVRGVKIQPSPDWLKNRIIACGLRPINNVVDVTNYVMLECGKPIHAFDLDRVAHRQLIVRRATDGEHFVTLDGKERILDSSMTVVADGERSSALGGIMGGQISEINDDTVNVCIESAIWLPSSIRRTAKKLGITSDAAYRFERGVDIETVVYAADRAAQLIAQVAGGTVASQPIDLYPTPQPRKQATVRYSRASMLIGKEIPPAEQRSLLERLGCSMVSTDEHSMTVAIPSFRVDVATETDLIEEIARLYGYDNIPPDMTSRINLSGAHTPPVLAPLAFKAPVSEFLRANGFHEVMTQTMIDPKSAALFTKAPVRIANPLGEELSCMRPSLVPSMLKVIERNLRFGQRNLRLFELGTVFSAVPAQTRNSVQTFVSGFQERQHLIVALTGAWTNHESGAKHWSGEERLVDVYDIKGTLEGLVRVLRLDNARLLPLKAIQQAEQDSSGSKTTLELLPDRGVFSTHAVEIVFPFSASMPIVIGYAGEISKTTRKAFDIEVPVLLCVLDFSAIARLNTTERRYKSVSAYPIVSRDIAFVVDASVEAEAIRQAILRAMGRYGRSVEIFDVFVGAEGRSVGAGKKSLAFALQYNADDKTLAESDVEESFASIVKAVTAEFDASLRQ